MLGRCTQAIWQVSCVQAAMGLAAPGVTVSPAPTGPPSPTSLASSAPIAQASYPP
jgi:hypothetical protein